MTDPADDPRSMRERMLAGDLYQAFDDELIGLRNEAARRCDALNATSIADLSELHRLGRELFASLGEMSIVLPRVHCDYGTNVHIGTGAFVNVGAVFLDVCPITLGDHVLLGSNVQLIAATHPLDAETRIAGWELGEAITVEDGAWLGAGAIVLPGVTIGARSVVGAGSVVTKDVPPDVLVVGNPARIVRSLDET